MKKIALMSLAVTTALLAGGYKIPESSLNAVALSNAYVANANGADASYYNPANMVFSENKGGAIEVDLTYIGLSAVDFKGTTGATQTDTSSKTENFIVPTLHYVSSAVGDFRFGLSIVSPAGLSKRWNDSPASLYSKEFTLQTVEINPTVAYKINDEFSIALGVRGIYSKGIVKNAYYSMDGTGFDYGYNLAVTLKPEKDTNLALTYRSEVDLHVKGDDTKLASGVKVALPVPATLSFGASHVFNGETTVEAVIEHNFWSAYKKLDFDFSKSNIEAIYGTPKAKNWKDTDTLRLGVTHKYQKITGMVGFAYDPSPTPNSTIGYELPDATGKIFSLGGRYDISKSFNVGIAGLVSFKDDRAVANSTLNGEFTNSRAYLVSLGMEYKF
jgi:long-chain fatty acid transport protein